MTIIISNFPTDHGDFITFLKGFKSLAPFVILFISSFITFYVMPGVLEISISKNLTAKPNNRSSHSGFVPSTGGVGVFIGLLTTINISAFFFSSYNDLIDLLAITGVAFFLLIIGIFDDIMNITTKRKFLLELLLSFIFVISTGLKITNFGGLLGLTDLPDIAAFIFTVFVIILIINSYNLIDGIDGLAGGLGGLISLILGILLFLSDYVYYSLICFALVGALTGFLIYNLSVQRKIFLGDSGSIYIGFIIAVEVIIFLKFSNIQPNQIIFKNAPLVVLALLSYPLFDTLRVFIIRLYHKRSPFSADKNHIHHQLIKLGFTHKRSSLIIILYTAIITGIAFLLNHLPINIAFIYLLITAIILLTSPFLLKRENERLKFVKPKL